MTLRCRVEIEIRRKLSALASKSICDPHSSPDSLCLGLRSRRPVKLEQLSDDSRSVPLGCNSNGMRISDVHREVKIWFPIINPFRPKRYSPGFTIF